MPVRLPGKVDQLHHYFYHAGISQPAFFQPLGFSKSSMSMVLTPGYCADATFSEEQNHRMMLPFFRMDPHKEDL
jgi:hypothetical protein